jgi:hypothetical protein
MKKYHCDRPASTALSKPAVAADKGGDDDGRIDHDKWCALIKIARPPLQRRGGADRREGDEVADRGMPPKNMRGSMKRCRHGNSLGARMDGCGLAVSLKVNP